jgi:hypothetical protein
MKPSGQGEVQGYRHPGSRNPETPPTTNNHGESAKGAKNHDPETARNLAQQSLDKLSVGSRNAHARKKFI